jgi:hypothetical protein
LDRAGLSGAFVAVAASLKRAPRLMLRHAFWVWNSRWHDGSRQSRGLRADFSATWRLATALPEPLVPVLDKPDPVPVGRGAAWCRGDAHWFVGSRLRRRDAPCRANPAGSRRSNAFVRVSKKITACERRFFGVKRLPGSSNSKVRPSVDLRSVTRPLALRFAKRPFRIFEILV